MLDYVRRLSSKDKEHLLDLARLLAIADKPILWDGKRSDEVCDALCKRPDLREYGMSPSLQSGEQENELIAGLENQCEHSRFLWQSDSFEKKLIERLSEIVGPLIAELEQEYGSKGEPSPVQTVGFARKIFVAFESEATRRQAATSLLKELLDDQEYDLPFVPKLLLFELMLVALCGGRISNIEMALLKEFQRHHQLEDFIFDDLLERAETMSREVSKTLSIILE
jgi:hypothetical protein